MSLTQIGLLFDIAGAIILVRALAFPTLDLLLKQSGTYWDYNKEMLHGLCKQRIDARFGLGFILTGFAIQLLGNSTFEQYQELNILIFSLLIVVVTAYFATRKYIIESDIEKAKKKLNQGNKN